MIIKKKSWFKVLITFIISTFALIFAFSFFNNKIDDFYILNKKRHNSQNLQQVNVNAQNGYALNPILDSEGKETGIFLKVPDFSVDPKKAELISTTYNFLPSNLTSTYNVEGHQDITSIFNILEFDKNTWAVGNNNSQSGVTANAKPIAFNLSSKRTYDENTYVNPNSTSGNNSEPKKANSLLIKSDKESLPAFGSRSDNDNIAFNEDFFDLNGILVVQLVLFDKSEARASDAQEGKYKTFYLTISGFSNKLSEITSNNITLPGELYSNTVFDITDKILLDSIKFSSTITPTPKNFNENLSKEIVKDSRNNDYSKGKIEFTAQFSWNIKNPVKFNTSFTGLLSDAMKKDNNGKVGLRYDETKSIPVVTKYSRDYEFSGFQPSPAISDTQVIIIVSSIVSGTIAICTILFLTIFIFQKIKRKR